MLPVLVHQVVVMLFSLTNNYFHLLPAEVKSSLRCARFHGPAWPGYASSGAFLVRQRHALPFIEEGRSSSLAKPRRASTRFFVPMQPFISVYYPIWYSTSLESWKLRNLVAL